MSCHYIYLGSVVTCFLKVFQGVASSIALGKVILHECDIFLLFFGVQENAAVYVCGDAKYMAHDVHKVLLKIIADQGQRTPEDALLYLKSMETEGRYQKDVWVT